MVNSSSNIPISTIYKIKPMQETVFIDCVLLWSRPDRPRLLVGSSEFDISGLLVLLGSEIAAKTIYDFPKYKSITIQKLKQQSTSR